MAELSVLERRNQLTQKLSAGFPKVLSQTPQLSPVPEGSVLAATYRQVNNIASVLNNSNNGLNMGDDLPGFDPLPYVPQQYMNFADKYIGLTNVGQVNSMNDIIRNEQNDKSIMAAYPYRSMAYGVVAGITDFPGLLMPGGVLYAEYKMGSSIAKSALSLGVASLAAAAVDETILYNSQYTRSVQESINNVAIRTILGSVLGAAGGFFAGRYGAKVLKAATKEASDIYENGQPTYKIEYKDGKLNIAGELPAPKPKDTPPLSKGVIKDGESWRTSGDASNEVPTSLNQNAPSGSYPPVEYNPKFEDVFTTPDSNANPFFTQGVFDESAKLSGLPNVLQKALKHNPALRLKTSEFNSANFISDMLFDTASGSVQTDIQGIAKPANLQAMIYSDYWKFNAKLLDIEDIFLKQAKGGLNREQFATELSYYVRNPGIISPSKDVARAVDIANNEIMKPMREWAVSLGKLQEWQEIEGYMMRIWNREYVIENQDDLTKIFYKYYKEVNEALRDILPRIQTLTKMLADLEKMIASTTDPKTKAVLEGQLAQGKKIFDAVHIQEFFGTRANHFVHDDGSYRTVKTDKELLADANETILNILSYGDDALQATMIARVLPKSSKPLKHRKILIHDNFLTNFVKKDGFDILSKYIKAMNPILSATKFSKSLGVNSLEEAATLFKETVRDEYVARSMSLDKKGKRKLEKKLKPLLQDIDDSFEIIMNVYGSPKNDDAWYVTFARTFRVFNTARLMGGMALATLTDLGTMSIRHGPMEVIYNGILPLLKSKEFRTMAKEELNSFGWALNHQAGQLIKTAADTGSLVVQPNKFSGTIDRTMQGFGTVTGINWTSNVLEMIAGTVSTNSILKSIETVVEGGKLNARDAKWLNRLGIDKKYYQSIYDMWKENGGTLDGNRYSNHQHWRLDTLEKAQAFDAFRIGLNRDMRHMLVRPGPETKPKAMYSEVGKTLFQFKSFFFAATDKILMSAIQDRKDIETMLGVMTLLAIGALHYVVQSWNNDQEPDLSIGNLTNQAISHSGILGIYSEYFNIALKFNSIPGLGSSKYQTRGVFGALGGPTVGGLEDIATFMGRINNAATEGKMLTSKDYAVMLRLMPYQNLFYTRKLSRYLLGIEGQGNSIKPIQGRRFNPRSEPVFNPEERKR